MADLIEFLMLLPWDVSHIQDCPLPLYSIFSIKEPGLDSHHDTKPGRGIKYVVSSCSPERVSEPLLRHLRRSSIPLSSAPSRCVVRCRFSHAYALPISSATQSRHSLHSVYLSLTWRP
jgi:hypothetical protein